MPEEGRFDARPHFVIPYWSSTGPNDPGDNGDIRPVPNNVVWYLCPGIHVSPYQPGEDLEVTVDIGNFGGANTSSIAQVTVWWAEPSSGFVVTPDKLIGYTTVEVDGRGGHESTGTMVKKIPSTAPDHICLLARVSHQYDRAGTTVDPINDRHWAQRNLVAVPAQTGTQFVLPFLAGNPFGEEFEFVVLAEPASEERFRGLSEAVRAHPVLLDARLTVAEGEDGEGVEVLRLALGPGEQRRLRVMVDLSSEVGPGEFGAVEVSQRRDDGERIVGGLGIVLIGE
jgi:hypothetical protein